MTCCNINTGNTAKLSEIFGVVDLISSWLPLAKRNTKRGLFKGYKLEKGVCSATRNDVVGKREKILNVTFKLGLIIIWFNYGWKIAFTYDMRDVEIFKKINSRKAAIEDE